MLTVNIYFDFIVYVVIVIIVVIAVIVIITVVFLFVVTVINQSINIESAYTETWPALYK